MLKLKLQYFATWWEVTHWKRPWCWERLKAGEGDDRGWDGLMASLTQWTWVSASSGSWWWTGRTGMPQSMGSQRVAHDWVTELSWRDQMACFSLSTMWGIQEENSHQVDWKNTHLKKVRSYVLFGDLTEDYSLGVNLSDSSEELFQRGKGGN